MRGTAVKEQQISFASDNFTLEGMLARPDTSTVQRGAVVCHPHPLYGGSMHNNVVEATLEAIWKLDWGTLRFNFRGVGGSEGEHSGGIGEADDAVAAVRYVGGQLGIASQKIVLAGYSFGAVAAMTAASKLRDLAALVLIALPIRMADSEALKRLSGPIILVAGNNDSYCPPVQIQAVRQALGSNAQLKIINGADHFFGGYEQDLTDALELMLKSI
jgi:uncharacterized protein